jgi:CHASE2 domain-containing sensor protein
MLWIAVCVATGMVGGKFADIEDRNPYVWGAATAAFAYVASGMLGAWFGLAPFLAIAACLAGLWAMKSRDDADRGGPGGKIVR